MAKQTLRKHKKLLETALSPPLPGMEHRTIKPLEDIAVQLLGIEGRRIFYAQRERELKAEALAILKKHKKTAYRREWVDMTIESTGEKLRIKLRGSPNGNYSGEPKKRRGRPRKDTQTSRDVSTIEDSGRAAEDLPAD